MKLLLSCPKCEKSLEVEATLSGSRTECAGCGQWFIVGQAGAQLPVVEPKAVLAPSDGGRPASVQGPEATPKGRAEPRDPPRAMGMETKGRLVRGPMPAGASFQRRKCAKCGSPMLISHGENRLLDFFLPLGNTVYWECERCGNEVKVQSPWRIVLLLLLSPLLLGWWFVFTESSRQHDANAPWWIRALEDLAPQDSKGSFWYIFFLVLFALAPLALIREVIVRLRYPRIL